MYLQRHECEAAGSNSQRQRAPRDGDKKEMEQHVIIASRGAERGGQALRRGRYAARLQHRRHAICTTAIHLFNRAQRLSNLTTFFAYPTWGTSI